MQFLKPFIALFLLLTYSIGFVQGVTSNCNHFSVGSSKDNATGKHDHDHHVHDGSELGDHHHVQHRDHFDENAFDLFICVLEDAAQQHAGADGCHCVPATDMRAASNWLTKIKLMAVVVPHFFHIEKEETTVEYAFSTVIGSTSEPFLQGFSQRGPPAIS